MILLKDRAILEISGPERKKFLQGLVTNDVEKASATNLIYTAMLNAQGRFLYDFFIFDNDEKLVLDCLAARRDEILKKLNFYKLRSQVEIKKNDELKVFSSHESKGFSDPRNQKLGFRFYGNEVGDNSNEYHFKRISLKIPESENDLTYEKSFILEFGFDELNAIDYNKGCYVGQELTARTHYRGEIRKKIFHIVLAQFEKVGGAISSEVAEGDLGSANSELASPKSSVTNSEEFTTPPFAKEATKEIYCEGKSVGVILSSVLHEKELHALALIKDPEEIDLTKLDYAGHKISIIN